MVQRQHDNGGADADPFGLGREVHREHQRTRQVAIRREVMLGAPNAVEAQPVRSLGHLRRSRKHVGRVLGARRLEQEEGSAIHKVCFRFGLLVSRPRRGRLSRRVERSVERREFVAPPAPG